MFAEEDVNKNLRFTLPKMQPPMDYEVKLEIGNSIKFGRIYPEIMFSPSMYVKQEEETSVTSANTSEDDKSTAKSKKGAKIKLDKKYYAEAMRRSRARKKSERESLEKQSKELQSENKILKSQILLLKKELERMTTSPEVSLVKVDHITENRFLKRELDRAREMTSQVKRFCQTLVERPFHYDFLTRGNRCLSHARTSFLSLCYSSVQDRLWNEHPFEYFATGVRAKSHSGCQVRCRSSIVGGFQMRKDVINIPLSVDDLQAALRSLGSPKGYDYYWKHYATALHEKFEHIYPIHVTSTKELEPHQAQLPESDSVSAAFMNVKLEEEDEVATSFLFIQSEERVESTSFPFREKPSHEENKTSKNIKRNDLLNARVIGFSSIPERLDAGEPLLKAGVVTPGEEEGTCNLTFLWKQDSVQSAIDRMTSVLPCTVKSLDIQTLIQTICLESEVFLDHAVGIALKMKRPSWDS